MRSGRPAWSDADVALLQAWYEHANYTGEPLRLDDLASRLGRHKTNVARKARFLGLTNANRGVVERDADGLRPCERRKREQRKFDSNEARREHQSRAQKEHTEETKRRVGEASRERNASLSQEKKAEIRAKITATNLDRYGTANPAFAFQEEPYSRTRGGKREDMDGRYFRSAWEANYCRYLNWLQDQGEIVSWQYEPETFRFDGVSRGPYTYTPDFRVVERDGRVVYHEVKGWMDSASKSRLRRMAQYYPDVCVIVIGEDEYKAIGKWKELIPNWEGRRRL